MSGGRLEYSRYRLEEIINTIEDEINNNEEIENVYIENYWDLFVGTIQRIGYFLFSPVPWMWRGLGDIVAFLASSCVYLSALIIAGISFIYKKTDYFRLLLLSVMFFVSGIFAWAVSNGGTALRHREKLLGVLILLGVYSVQIIINARRERKNA